MYINMYMYIFRFGVCFKRGLLSSIILARLMAIAGQKSFSLYWLTARDVSTQSKCNTIINMNILCIFFLFKSVQSKRKWSTWAFRVHLLSDPASLLFYQQHILQSSISHLHVLTHHNTRLRVFWSATPGVPVRSMASTLLEEAERAPDANCVRILVLGSSRVGKTAIVRRFVVSPYVIRRQPRSAGGSSSSPDMRYQLTSGTI